MVFSDEEDWHAGKHACLLASLERQPFPSHVLQTEASSYTTTEDKVLTRDFAPSAGPDGSRGRAVKREQSARPGGANSGSDLLDVLTLVVHKSWRRVQLQWQRAELEGKIRQLDQRAAADLDNVRNYVGLRLSAGVPIQKVVAACTDRIASTLAARDALVRKRLAVELELEELDRPAG
jgi:hypothetical protein